MTLSSDGFTVWCDKNISTLKGALRYSLSRLYCKLSLVFLILLLIVGSMQFVITRHYSKLYTAAADQTLNNTLADNFQRKFQPALDHGIDRLDVKKLVAEIEAMNRKARVYLLDRYGVIKLGFHHENEMPRPFVRLEPIKDYLEKGPPAFPLFGDDPLDLHGVKPFSVAPVMIGKQPGYLYVILSEMEPDQSRWRSGSSSIARSIIGWITAVLIVSAVAGLVLFFLLTRRLSNVTRAVQAFEVGRLEERIPAGSLDEIGALARAFNNMADTIAGQINTIVNNDIKRRELIAGISHDIKKPLTSVQGYLETILMKYGQLNDEERKSQLAVAFRNSSYVVKLVEQLFELAKLDAVDRPVEMKPFSLFEICEGVIEKVSGAAKEKGVVIVNSVPSRLRKVLGDASLVERALANLADNSIRHSPEGGRVELAAVADKNHHFRPFLPCLSLIHLKSQIGQVQCNQIGYVLIIFYYDYFLLRLLVHYFKVTL